MVVIRTCKTIKEGGEACRASPLQDGDYCFVHAPEYAADMQEARRLGGLRRRREKAIGGAYDFEGLGTVPQIRRLVEVAVLDTLALENTVSRARALAYLAHTATKLLEVGELEQQLERVEHTLEPRLLAQKGRR